MFDALFIYSGLIASLWMVLGVFIAGSKYQGYCHSKQLCSELGATGSPTEKLTPLINHYPLGVFYCLFGWHVAALQPESMLVIISGGLIIFHGLATWVAGYFPMDADAYTKTPSFNCKVHTTVGIMMFMALFVSTVLIMFAPQSDYITIKFKVFSIVCAVATIVFTITLAMAFKRKTNPGTHQRLSYGTQLIWLSGFSLVLGQ